MHLCLSEAILQFFFSYSHFVPLRSSGAASPSHHEIPVYYVHYYQVGSSLLMWPYHINISLNHLVSHQTLLLLLKSPICVDLTVSMFLMFITHVSAPYVIVHRVINFHHGSFGNTILQSAA